MGLGGSPEGILRHSGDSPDVPLPSAMGLEIRWRHGLQHVLVLQESRTGDPP